jgi:hypothetical protein
MITYPAGTEYRVLVVANNTYAQSQDVSNSDFEIVQNNPPVITAVAITNTPAYTDTTLQGQCNATDDGISQPLTYTYDWYKNNVSLGINSATLSGSYFSKHDLIKVSCSVFDGLVTVGQNSTEIEIQNTLPTTPVISSPANMSTTGLATIPISYSASDVDGDTLTYAVYVDSSNPPTTLVQNSTMTQYLFGGSDGTYRAKVIVSDGEETRESGVTTFTKDTTPPVVSIIYPTNLLRIMGKDVFVKFGVSSQYNISSCHLYLKDVLYRNYTDVNLNRTYTSPIMSLSYDEGYTFYVECFDNFGARGVTNELAFFTRMPEASMPSANSNTNTRLDVTDGAKQVKVNETTSEFKKAATTGMGVAQERISQLEEAWSKIPFIGGIAFKQAFAMFAIVFVTYYAIYGSRPRRRIK